MHNHLNSNASQNNKKKWIKYQTYVICNYTVNPSLQITCKHLGCHIHNKLIEEKTPIQINNNILLICYAKHNIYMFSSSSVAPVALHKSSRPMLFTNHLMLLWLSPATNLMRHDLAVPIVPRFLVQKLAVPFTASINPTYKITSTVFADVSFYMTIHT